MRWLGALLCFVALQLNSQTVIHYRFEGNISGNNGRMIYLSTFEDRFNKLEPIRVDSALIDDKGTFVIEGDGEMGRIMEVAINYNRAQVILEPGVVKIDYKQPFNANLGGAPLNNELIAFQQENGDLLRSRNQLQFKISDDPALDKVQKERMVERIKDSTTNVVLDIAEKYIKRNKENGVAEYALYEALRYTGDDIEPYDRLYSLMDRRAVSFGFLNSAIARLEQVRKTSPGCKFSDFTVPNGRLEGGSVSLSDYVGKGKFILMDFWASWCTWCRAEFPTLAKVYEKHKGPDFEIVGLVVDDKLDATKKALQKDTMVVWPQIVNAGAKERELYGVMGIPQIILFAPDGTIVARNLRGQTLVDTVDKVMSDYRKSK